MISKNKIIQIPNYLEIFRNHGIYVSGCDKLLQECKKDVKQLVKRSMAGYYLRGQSAFPVDIVFEIAKKRPELLDKFFELAETFSTRASTGHKLPKYATDDLAYFIGCLRDGYLSGSKFEVSVSQKNKEWLEYLQKISKKLFGVESRIRKLRNAFELRIFSKPLFLFLNNVFEMPANRVSWKTPKFIKDNKDLWIPYISGFFDAEGYCTSPTTYIKTEKKKISFHQNDLESLEFIKNVLAEFDIETGNVFLQNGRNCYALYIQSKNNIQKFASVFKPVQKRKRLNDLVSVLLP